MSSNTLGNVLPAGRSPPAYKNKEAQEYVNSKHYKFIRTVQENTTLNRTFLMIGGIELPIVGTELIGRNWKTAAESFLRISLYLLTSLAVPLGLVPIWNKMSAKKHALPDKFNHIFEQQFEDLLPEKDIKTFKDKLIEIEGEDKVKDYLGNDESSHEQKLKDLKGKLVEAKADVVYKDKMSDGILTYIVPWIQVWFSKAVLKVTGFSGESHLLSEAEQEQSSEFHEKTKYLKFIGGALLTLFGTHKYAGLIKKAASEPQTDENKAGLQGFFRKHIKQFDYYKEKFGRRMNLFGTYLFGGIGGFLLTSRSLNEFIERALRMCVENPLTFWGDAFIHSKLAERADKNEGTTLIAPNSKPEFGARAVKSLGELEKELHTADSSEDENQIKKGLNSMKRQINLYYKSMIIDGLLMGVLTTGFNIWNTTRRVLAGKY